MTERYKVSYDVRNDQIFNPSYGRLLERSYEFDSLKAAIQFLNKIHKGMREGGYEVFTTPVLE